MKEAATVEKKDSSRLVLQVGCSLLFACIYLSAFVFLGVFSDGWDAADLSPAPIHEFQPMDDEPEESNSFDLLLTVNQKAARTVLRRTARPDSYNISDVLLREKYWIGKVHIPAGYLFKKLSFLSFQCTNNLFVRDGPCINLFS